MGKRKREIEEPPLDAVEDGDGAAEVSARPERVSQPAGNIGGLDARTMGATWKAQGLACRRKRLLELARRDHDVAWLLMQFEAHGGKLVG